MSTHHVTTDGSHIIDLKWSLWSADIGHWEEYAPELLPVMRNCLVEKLPLYIMTAPRKEIRSGTVELLPDRGYINVIFNCEWDDLHDLCDTLSCTEEELQGLLTATEHGEPGTMLQEHVPWTTDLEKFLADVDAVEDALLKLDAEAWENLERIFAKEA